MVEGGYASSFSRWMSALDQNRNESLAHVLRAAYGNHIKTLDAIHEMGLPMMPWGHSSLPVFLTDPNALASSLPATTYDVTLAPRNEQEPLYFKGNVPFEEVFPFVARRSVKTSGAYDVILQKSCRIRYGGVILSQKEGILVEMAKEGTSTVVHGIAGEKNELYRLRKKPTDISCKYSTEDKEVRQLLWQSIAPLHRHADAQGDFLPGYFEFNYNETGRNHPALVYINFKSSSLFLAHP